MLTKKDMVSARRYFDKAIELNPKSVEALNGLIAIDVAGKKPDAARSPSMRR